MCEIMTPLEEITMTNNDEQYKCLQCNAFDADQPEEDRWTWSKKEVHKWLFLSHIKGPLLAGSYRTVHAIWGMMLGTMIKIIKKKHPAQKTPLS